MKKVFFGNELIGTGKKARIFLKRMDRAYSLFKEENKAFEEARARGDLDMELHHDMWVNTYLDDFYFFYSAGLRGDAGIKVRFCR